MKTLIKYALEGLFLRNIFYKKIKKFLLIIILRFIKYALEGLFSIKSDVFSFGVILLEIMSGKKNTDFIKLTVSILLDM
jgi:hypothetical protein